MTDTNTEVETIETKLYTYANPNGHVKDMEALLRMFYSGSFDNRIGIMQAFNSATKQEELVLVGIEGEGSPGEVFPIAKILAKEDVEHYHSPDGKGGFVGVENVS